MRASVVARLRPRAIALLILTFSTVAAASAPQVADAVKARNLPLLNSLLSQLADVNAPQTDGTTALHWAAYWDDGATVNRLLRAGARVDAANRYGVTPLFVAATNGNAPIIGRLLEAGADANTAAGTATGEGESALMAASRTGNVEGVKLLLGPVPMCTPVRAGTSSRR